MLKSVRVEEKTHKYVVGSTIVLPSWIAERTRSVIRDYSYQKWVCLTLSEMFLAYWAPWYTGMSRLARFERSPPDPDLSRSRSLGGLQSVRSLSHNGRLTVVLAHDRWV